MDRREQTEKPGKAVNIYLRAETHAKLVALREKWRCSWGEVIRRLLEKRGAS
jgi:predicted CopG family antitoxin